MVSIILWLNLFKIQNDEREFIEELQNDKINKLINSINILRIYWLNVYKELDFNKNIHQYEKSLAIQCKKLYL